MCSYQGFRTAMHHKQTCTIHDALQTYPLRADGAYGTRYRDLFMTWLALAFYCAEVFPRSSRVESDSLIMQVRYLDLSFPSFPQLCIHCSEHPPSKEDPPLSLVHLPHLQHEVLRFDFPPGRGFAIGRGIWPLGTRAM
jgi:hypothetical protein